MNHMQFFKLIKDGELAGAYLLHGKEEFIKARAVEQVTALIDEAVRPMNMQQFDEGASADAIIGACETPPFFAERRLVICRAMPKDTDGARLAEYVPMIAPTTVVLFRITGDADGRSALTKKLRDLGREVQFGPLSPVDAAKWVRQQCARQNTSIDPQDAAYFISLTGTDMSTVNNELSKLSAYCLGRAINRADIDELVAGRSEYKMYKLLDMFIANKYGEGLRMLESFIADGDSPMMIAATIANRLKTILRAKELREKGVAKSAAVREIGGNPYAAESAWDASRRFTVSELTAATAAFYDVGYMTVTGRQKDRDALNSAVYNHLIRQ